MSLSLFSFVPLTLEEGGDWGEGFVTVGELYTMRQLQSSLTQSRKSFVMD